MDGLLHVEVKDEGIGIPVEDQQHLFERFFRASNAFTVQGTGLGLNIVRKYMDLMGGTIGFISEPGKGTTFTAQLPQHHAHEEHPVDRG
jgi:signal transduction histidine kinase